MASVGLLAFASLPTLVAIRNLASTKAANRPLAAVRSHRMLAHRVLDHSLGQVELDRSPEERQVA